MHYIKLVLYSKGKSSITAPADNKIHLQASETQRYQERSRLPECAPFSTDVRKHEIVSYFTLDKLYRGIRSLTGK